MTEPAAPPATAEYLTFTEVAGILRLGPVRTADLLRDGMFPGAYKLGDARSSSWRIPRADLDAFIARQVAKAQQARSRDAA